MMPGLPLTPWAATTALIALTFLGAAALAAEPAATPNVVVILADDPGYGDLGCFGQQKLKTPRLDAMAAEGMRLAQWYARATVCAPSSCVLLTGKHGGQCTVRGNDSRSGKPVSLSPDEPTVASVLKKAGYATGCVGKWGLGTFTDVNNPRVMGFDYFYGYLNNHHAHNCFPEFLFRNGAVEKLNNVMAAAWKPHQDPAGDLAGAGRGVAEKNVDYAPDLLTADAMRFIREHRERPFFLHLALNTPHANNEAAKAGMEVPDYGEFASEDWPAAEKGFASMIRNLDSDVGKVLDLLKELRLDKNTLVLFTSENGPHAEGGNDPAFFQSSGKFRGKKRDLTEGGIRVPTIAWWPSVIAPNSVSDLPMVQRRMMVRGLGPRVAQSPFLP